MKYNKVSPLPLYSIDEEDQASECCTILFAFLLMGVVASVIYALIYLALFLTGKSL